LHSILTYNYKKTIKMDILTQENQCRTMVHDYSACAIINYQSNVITDYSACAIINYQLISKVNQLTSKVNQLILIRSRIYLRKQMASCVLSTSKHFQYLKIHLPRCFRQGEKCSPKSAFFRTIINFKGLQQNVKKPATFFKKMTGFCSIINKLISIM